MIKYYDNYVFFKTSYKTIVHLDNLFAPEVKVQELFTLIYNDLNYVFFK